MKQPNVASGASAEDAYPLNWPFGWVRTPPPDRKRARYEVTLVHARDELLNSLRLLGAENIVMSTNMPLRRDGMFYAGDEHKSLDDPGVAVYWRRNDRNEVMACDCWLTLRENVRAIGLTIDGLRAMQRAGASELLQRAFDGFKALPANAAQRDWRTVLGLEMMPLAEITEAVLDTTFKALSRTLHPDVPTGSKGAFLELQRAIAEARSTIRR